MVKFPGALLRKDESRVLLWGLIFFFFCLTNLFLFAQTPVLKIDLNVADRQEAEVNETGYIPWLINGGPDSMILEGVKVAFKNAAIDYHWYKAGVQLLYFARLVNDVISSNQVEIHSTGLQKVKHSMVTFHNTFDNPETNTFSPMDVYLNDSLVIND